MDILNFKYKKIKKFFNRTEINILKKYCVKKHMDNDKNFDYLQGGNADTFFYKDPLIEVLLENKKNILEKELKIKLSSSYSFWRCYTYGAVLKEHLDRPSCEFSVTAFIDSDKKDWPIYMEDTPINLEIGDAVIYKGTDVKHSRKKFYGDYHIQAFLHYVDQNGPYKDYKGDENWRKK